MATSTISLERIDEIGVVGAGGAGFPTSVKLKAPASVFIVNAAECEPLLHKDKELLHHLTAPMLRGLRTAMHHTGAKEGVIGIKEKYVDVMDAIRPQLPADIRIQALKDCYPAGDEFLLVYDVTGKVIPPGGLPKDVDAAVANVETLVNIGEDSPVIYKYLTVAGAVHEPVTLKVPIGVTIRECIEAAGGATVSEFGALLGGTMMGKQCHNLEEPVTKTLGGIVVLPKTHHLISWYATPWKHTEKIARSACDQCRFCTELCPRYLLGHPIQPHRAMASVGFTGNKAVLIAGTLSCCECNLCSLYACPENLDPKTVCVAAKPMARELDLTWKGNPADVKAHPLAADRRAPMKRLIQKLGLTEFRNVGPLVDRQMVARRIVLPLKQHAGAPSVATVAAGDRVKQGDVVAAPAPKMLGARIHSSISGIVREASTTTIVIEAA